MYYRAFKISLKFRVRAFTLLYIGWTFKKLGLWSYTSVSQMELHLSTATADQADPHVGALVHAGAGVLRPRRRRVGSIVPPPTLRQRASADNELSWVSVASRGHLECIFSRAKLNRNQAD